MFPMPLPSVMPLLSLSIPAINYRFFSPLHKKLIYYQKLRSSPVYGRVRSGFVLR
ncbi:hypothetical protein FORC065_4131 [Yersinia enterocolitica]|nr:hypothetical protein FORC065_4131 [Yersinia enterocolitica]